MYICIYICLATRGPIHIIRQALPDESFELLRRSHIHNICIYILSCQAWPDTIHITRQALPDESFITSLYFACVHADAAHCGEAQEEQSRTKRKLTENWQCPTLYKVMHDPLISVFCELTFVRACVRACVRVLC